MAEIKDTLVNRILEFQDKEIDRWISEQLPREKVCELAGLDAIAREKYTLICDATKKGIKSGTKELLEKKGRKGKPVYPTCFDDIGPAMQVLYFFCTDNPLEIHIAKELKSLGIFGETPINAISGYACEHYGTFANTNSLRKYMTTFSEDVSPKHGLAK